MESSLLNAIEEELKYGTNAQKEYITLILKKIGGVELSQLKKEIEEIVKRLNEFEEKYRLNSEEFFKRFDEGKMGDDREFIKWYAYKDSLEGLKKRYNRLREQID